MPAAFLLDQHGQRSEGFLSNYVLDNTKLFCIKNLSFCEYSCVNILEGTIHIFRACIIIICKVLCWILHGHLYHFWNKDRACSSFQI